MSHLLLAVCIHGHFASNPEGSEGVERYHGKMGTHRIVMYDDIYVGNDDRSNIRQVRALTFFQRTWRDILKQARALPVVESTEKVYHKRGTYKDALKDFFTFMPSQTWRKRDGDLYVVYGRVGNQIITLTKSKSAKAILAVKGNKHMVLENDTPPFKTARKIYYNDKTYK